MVRKTIILVVFLVSTLAGFTQLPSSERSIEAIDRTWPVLKEEFDEREITSGSPIFIRIFKMEKVLEVWVEKEGTFVLFRTYEICDFSGDLGPKTRQGDFQSPEGFYFVNAGRMNPFSRYHLAMNVGYPNLYDRNKGYTGDYLMIHGQCRSIGCYAMTDAYIEEIYTLADKALSSGQSFFRVHIFPFKMTSENMEEFSENRWYPFWENLKQGYDWFEKDHIPPNVEVNSGRYVFN